MIKTVLGERGASKLYLENVDIFLVLFEKSVFSFEQNEGCLFKLLLSGRCVPIEEFSI